jgi:hypothetical protein
MANTEKKRAEAEVERPRDKGAERRKPASKDQPSGDSPKPHGDPMRHLLTDDK